MKQKVVIIGYGSTTRLGIVRALAEMDCEITAIVTSFKDRRGRLNTSKPFDCYSRYISRVLYIFAGEAEGLVRMLLDECSDSYQKVILLPYSDFAAATIDEAQELLRDGFLFPHIHHTSGAVRGWMDKSRQKELARTVGLLCAGSCEIAIKNGRYSIPEGIHYPCFTKPVISFVGGKRLFLRCENEEQLRSLLSRAGTRGDMVIMVEDYISIENEYAILGFSDGKQVVIPGVIRFIKNSNSHFGIAMTGDILPVNGFEDLLERFRQFVLRIGFVGVFDIDFLWGDGKWWFDEINLRFGGSGYVVTRQGVNLPVMLYRYFRKEDWSNIAQLVTKKATFVNEKICMDDWYEGYLTTAEFKQILRSAEVSFVDDKVDPKPLAVFKKEFRLKALKRVVKKLLGK